MFKPYEPTRQRQGAIGATALNTGVIQLTTSAFRALGGPAYVALAVDAEQYLIRVRLASPDDPGAVAVGQVRRVAATRLLRDAGIAYQPTSVPLPGRMNGRTEMVLDYSEAPTGQVTPMRRAS